MALQVNFYWYNVYSQIDIQSAMEEYRIAECVFSRSANKRTHCVHTYAELVLLEMNLIATRQQPTPADAQPQNHNKTIAK